MTEQRDDGQIDNVMEPITILQNLIDEIEPDILTCKDTTSDDPEKVLMGVTIDDLSTIFRLFHLTGKINKDLC